MMTALRPHIGHSSARLSTLKPAVRSQPTEVSTPTPEFSAAFRFLGFL